MTNEFLLFESSLDICCNILTIIIDDLDISAPQHLRYKKAQDKTENPHLGKRLILLKTCGE